MREAANNTVGVIQSLSRIGVLYERVKAYDVALDYYQKSVEIAERTNNQHVMTRALNHIGVYHRRNGNLETALTYFQQSLQINRANDNVELLLFALDLVGEALYEHNHHIEETPGYYQQALEIADKLDFKLAIIRTLLLLASLYTDIDHSKQAHAPYQRIVDIAIPINYQRLLQLANIKLQAL